MAAYAMLPIAVAVPIAASGIEYADMRADDDGLNLIRAAMARGAAVTSRATTLARQSRRGRANDYCGRQGQAEQFFHGILLYTVRILKKKSRDQTPRCSRQFHHSGLRVSHCSRRLFGSVLRVTGGAYEPAYQRRGILSAAAHCLNVDVELIDERRER